MNEIVLSETVTHYYTVKLSDEIDEEEFIKKANQVRKQCSNGHEAIAQVLKEYEKINPNEFSWVICGGEEWDKIESPIEYEY